MTELKTRDAVVSGAAGATAAAGGCGTAGSPTGTGAMQTFQGFLKRAGTMLNTALTEIVRYVVPIAQVVAVADPATSAEVRAFTTAVSLVQTAVLSAQQRWSGAGSAANGQKLADVLVTVEQPIVLLFAQAGVQVDAAYVTNLVNGVVALLNAQPAGLLRGAATTALSGTGAAAAAV